jgi:hypothetical protein
MTDDDEKKRESLALLHVIQSAEYERAEKADKLSTVALTLEEAISPALEAISAAPGMSREDTLQCIDADAHGAEIAAEIISKGAKPEECEKAYNEKLSDFESIASEIRAANAREHLENAAGYRESGNAEKAAEEEEKARATLDRPLVAEKRLDLVELWEAHKEGMSSEAAEDSEAVRFNERRGEWAEWLNRFLGPRNGLQGRNSFLIGGGPNSGKTSFAGALAVDAMRTGCPVLFYNVELSPERTLEHIVDQSRDADDNDGSFMDYRKAFNAPKEWRKMLDVPGDTSLFVEDVVEQIKRFARNTEGARRAGRIEHAVNGLVIVDYLQLLSIRDRHGKDAGFEVVAKCASQLVKTVEATGCALLLLSQATKDAQGKIGGSNIAFSGIDGRTGDAGVFIEKKKDDDDENPNLRTIHHVKNRGIFEAAQGIEWNREIEFNPQTRKIQDC